MPQLASFILILMSNANKEQNSHITNRLARATLTKAPFPLESSFVVQRLDMQQHSEVERLQILYTDTKQCMYEAGENYTTSKQKITNKTHN